MGRGRGGRGRRPAWLASSLTQVQLAELRVPELHRHVVRGQPELAPRVLAGAQARHEVRTRAAGAGIAPCPRTRAPTNLYRSGGRINVRSFGSAPGVQTIRFDPVAADPSTSLPADVYLYPYNSDDDSDVYVLKWIPIFNGNCWWY